MVGNTQTHGVRPTGRGRGNRWSAVTWAAAACLLLLPAVAMRFTDEVDWGAEDFIVMGVMLAAACGSYELATRLSGGRSYRAASAVAIAGGFLLVWVNLAVGMIGSEDHPANLLYAGVLTVGLVGAVFVRFRAGGMARVTVAMAVAQMLVALAAVAAGWGAPYSPPAEVLGVSALFAVPWLMSAALFRHAARPRPAG